VRQILWMILFLIVLVSLLANPAPASIEFADLILIALPCLLVALSLAIGINYKVYSIERNLLIAIGMYLGYFLLSALVSLLSGVPLLNMLRSIGPYISFFPLIFIGFLPRGIISIRSIGLILMIVGFFQISYLFYLYFTHASNVSSTLGVLQARITFLDQRTTLPLILAIGILPVIFISANKRLLSILMLTLIILGFFAGIITLTRSIILSIIFVWLIFFISKLYQQHCLKILNWQRLLTNTIIYSMCLIIFFGLINLIPRAHLLFTGLLSRFADHAANGGTDYSNGRLYDEWLPALMTWLHSGWLGFFFGIGAGNAFIVTSGEERTYIHNLTVYSLVYGGIYGLFSCLWLYFILFKTLIIRSLQTNDQVYLVFAALLAGLFFYGQFFAVHKGLAFNIMLFLIIAVALMQPRKI